MCLSVWGLDVQPSRAPPCGQPAMEVEQLQTPGFGEREPQHVEHLGGGAGGECLLGCRARPRRAHLAHGPLHKRQCRRRDRERLVAEPDQQECRERLGGPFTAHTPPPPPPSPPPPPPL